MASDNVVSTELSNDRRNDQCLSDDQVVTLSKIGVELERYYGDARDIEWALFEVRSKLET